MQIHIINEIDAEGEAINAALTKSKPIYFNCR